MKVYLAGKISRWDWRHSIVKGLSWRQDEINTERNLQLFSLDNAIDGGHDYVGPFFQTLGGHGAGHGPNTHGRGMGKFATYGMDLHDGCDFSEIGYGAALDTKGKVFFQCAVQIQRADLVFAWIDDPSAYGTLVEIGMASSLGKDVWVGGYPIEDLWFAFAAATHVEFVQGPNDTAEMVWKRMLAEHGASLEYDVKYWRERSAEEKQQRAATAQFVEYAQRNRPNQLRADVWSKTGGICWYCGGELNPFLNFHVEHQHPRSKGGSDRLDNLVPACRDCNLSKGDLTVDQFRWRRGVSKFHGETPALAAGEGA